MVINRAEEWRGWSFPAGIVEITEEGLRQVAAAESVLRRHGLRTVRVRHHGSTARIEVGSEEIAALLEDDIRANIVTRLKKLGYVYITLDLEGYRSGSMNEVLDNETKTTPGKE